ncbi:chaperonin 10-like protein [Mycena crocata]|nr:chaperonin 10-like protein [Mycena crocata]
MSSIRQQQQALILEFPKAPFTVGKRDIPQPAKGEVLIKLMYVGLNPVNWAQREFNFLIDEYPAVLGMDNAGVIEELGEGVEGFKKGDRVFCESLLNGFQQYNAVPVATLINIPQGVSFDEVATIPCTFATACVGLFAPAPIGLSLNPTFSWDKPQQGESALVLGAGTSVGQFAIQLLKFAGFTRIVAYASKVHFDYLKQLGATDCIDRTDVSTAALSTHPALLPPVKVVADCTLGELDAAYDCVADGGCLMAVQPMAKCAREGKQVNLVHTMGYLTGPDVLSFKNKDIEVTGSTLEHTTFGKLAIENLPRMLATKAVVANRLEVLPGGLSGIPDGLERLKKGVSTH